MTKRKSKGAYMISAVAEMYDIHPQTLRLYEREGLLKPSRTEGNTRLYTDEDLQRLEFILSLARDLGVNISGIAIILQMRERMVPLPSSFSLVLALAKSVIDPEKLIRFPWVPMFGKISRVADLHNARFPCVSRRESKRGGYC